MENRLIELEVENFRSLRDVTVPLGALNVLVGPNGVGKTNLVDVFRFLADLVGTDLEPALDRRGGYEDLAFAGGDAVPDHIRIRVKATWTQHSSPTTPDEYELTVTSLSDSLSRRETFGFRPAEGRRRQVVVSGENIDVQDDDAPKRKIGIRRLSSALSTLPRLSQYEVDVEVGTIARHLASFRAFDIWVDKARRPARVPRGNTVALDDDGANLAAFLLTLRELAVAEIEAWLLLFPEALSGLVQAWRVPARYRGCDTGRVSDPKQIMMREVSGDPRRYRESDAPAVFEKAVSLACLDRPAGTNRSWTQLRDDSTQCCQTHLPAQLGRQHG